MKREKISVGLVGPTPGAEFGCTPPAAYFEHLQIRNEAVDAGCDDVCEPVDSYGDVYSCRFSLDEEGYVIGMEREDGEPISDEIVDCNLEAVADQTFPCLAEIPSWESCEPMPLE